MFVYFHGAKTGHNLAMAFHKADKAADYVINQIDTYIGGKAILGKKSYKKAARAIAAQPLAFEAQFNPAPEPDMPDMDDGPMPAIAAPGQPFWGGPVQQNPIQAIYNNMVVESAPTNKDSKNNPERDVLLAHMEIARKDRTFDNAVKAIELYEEYAKYTLSTDAALHTLREIKIVE